MSEVTDAAIAKAVVEAQEALAAGNLVLADIAARDVLDHRPRHAEAMAVIENVATALGLSEPYAQAFGGPASGRFMLVKAWGEGFWSDMFHVLGCLLLAEATGRTPIIHWGANSRFGDGKGEAFRHHWRPLNDLRPADLPATSVYPPKWNASNLDREDFNKWSGSYSRQGAILFLNRPEDLAVCDFHISVLHVLPWLPPSHPMKGRSVEEACRYLVQRYLQPNPRVIAEAEAFSRRFLAGRPAAAVHLRGTDKIGEIPNLNDYLEGYFTLLDRLPAHTALYTLTDDDALLERMRERYGGRVVTTQSTRSAGETGLHFAPDADGVRLGHEVMVDTLLALGCGAFIGNGYSNVSAAVRVLKAWPPGATVLLGPPIHERRNPFLFRDPA